MALNGAARVSKRFFGSKKSRDTVRRAHVAVTAQLGRELPHRNHDRAGAGHGPRYFRRKLLVTTVTLESAMAADASIGERSPNAATGIPSAL